MVKLDRVEHAVAFPEGVSVSIDGDNVTITGPSGSLSREFSSSRVEIFQEGGGLLVRVDIPRRKERALAGTPCGRETDGQCYSAGICHMCVGVRDA